MNITGEMFLVVCPLLFLAGFIDSIGGGGGLISLPAYLLAGLPYQTAMGCNKLSSSFGVATSTVRFLKKGFLNVRLVIPTVIASVLGSTLGARLMIHIDNSFMEAMLLVLLPVSALVIFLPGAFRPDSRWKGAPGPKVWICAIAVALVMGFYCGFYGPGSGTFMILAFTIFAGMSTPQANAHTKVINLTANITTLTVLLQSGQLPIFLSLAGAACHMTGSFLGSGIAMKNNVRISRTIVLLVLAMLFVKILTGS